MVATNEIPIIKISRQKYPKVSKPKTGVIDNKVKKYYPKNIDNYFQIINLF
jgi:hypothetical protein